MILDYGFLEKDRYTVFLLSTVQALYFLSHFQNRSKSN